MKVGPEIGQNQKSITIELFVLSVICRSDGLQFDRSRHQSTELRKQLDEVAKRSHRDDVDEGEQGNLNEC